MKHVLALCLALPLAAFAATPEFALEIKDHRFSPEEVHVPAGTKVKLRVHNQDSTPEEFESHQLNREKVIAPGSTASIFIGPLKPGKYTFVGEFHEDTARGVVIAE
ncbi:cupredoxin domain-containing protein [Cognatazoarcus halotolerans]|uniref:cupredoxin domain-containing protein n=1 Tax=Cognatazoarcus halotolerans TaxID=2686016 RepID=UPI001356CB63|nr:cupredoxin domain-containing protein [Cognatazoarcus halotolerans]MCB1900896.1 cupredoxin domain-containing protein [Rhodocyclaceae bacterium]MCP5308659.1 cupredoxin domain-containing protein [Zoogloeaceae bacterium]